jgi:hypothetical protein
MPVISPAIAMSPAFWSANVLDQRVVHAQHDRAGVLEPFLADHADELVLVFILFFADTRCLGDVRGQLIVIHLRAFFAALHQLDPEREPEKPRDDEVEPDFQAVRLCLDPGVVRPELGVFAFILGYGFENLAVLLLFHALGQFRVDFVLRDLVPLRLFDLFFQVLGKGGFRHGGVLLVVILIIHSISIIHKRKVFVLCSADPRFDERRGAC